MQFIDLAAQQQRIRKQIDKNIAAVLDHGQYIMGPEIAELELLLADYVGSKHCITVSSGTDALLIAMMALGISRGDEVITTPFTFIATGEMIALLGATPVFVDIDPATYNMDPNLLEAAITDKTKAIMPVSLYGQCADMHVINAIAAKYRIPVIEDAAQSFGATHHGKKSCALTTIGCTSFFPSKPLGGYGDGGACFTDNDNLAALMQSIRVHGQAKRYHHEYLGVNGRLDTLQAAVLIAKLDIFDDEVDARMKLGEYYTQRFLQHGAEYSGRRCDLSKQVLVPMIMQNNTSVYGQYTIQVNHRDYVQEVLKEKGIPTAVHYPKPLNAQPAISQYIDQNVELPISNALSSRVMSLPFHPYMTHEQINHIVDTVVVCANNSTSLVDS